MSNMDKDTFRHSANRLTYAINTTGKFVDIDSVSNGNKCGCFCPACKEPLVAKNQGSKRVHHFAHQFGTECDCAFESMLHLLAKEKIRETFLSKSEFWIEFEYKSFCPKYKECYFIRHNECYVSKKQHFDVKRFYDSCEQEIAYDSINRRSDLKIFSSTNPERSPIYLEFCVTHASELEKLHCGSKIIEICITSQEDVRKVSEHGITESKYCNNDGYNDLGSHSQQVSFYGFKNIDYENNLISNEIDFVRYILYKSGKTQCFQDYCNCKNLAKSRPSSLFEICVHTPVAFGIYEFVKYIGFQKFRIPNCILCKNYVDSYYDTDKICRLYKYLHIPCDDTFDTSRAKTCRYFTIDHVKMQSVLEKGLDRVYTIL